MTFFVNDLLKSSDGFLAWDGYAVAQAPLADGELFTFFISQDEVGVAVGVQSVFAGDRGPGYANMLLSIVATTKKYSVYVGSTLITGPTAYDPTKPFAIGRSQGNLIAFVDGVPKHTIAYTGEVIAAASIYGPWDHVYDAEPSAAVIQTSSAGFGSTSGFKVIPQFKMLGASGAPSTSGFGAGFIRVTNFVFAFGFGHESRSGAGFTPIVTPVFPTRGVAAEASTSGFGAANQAISGGGSANPQYLAGTISEGSDPQYTGGGVSTLASMEGAAYAGMIAPVYALSYGTLEAPTSTGTMTLYGSTISYPEAGGSDPTAPPDIIADPYGFAAWQAGLLGKLVPLAALGWDHAPDSYAYGTLAGIEGEAAAAIDNTLTLDGILPRPTMQARATAQLGNRLDATIPLPVLTAQGGHQGEASIGKPSIAAHMIVTGMMRLDGTIAVSGSAHMAVGSVGRLNGTLTVTGSARAGARGAARLPRLVSDAEATLGNVARADLTLPRLVLASSMDAEDFSRASLILPRVVSVWGVLDASLPTMRIYAEAIVNPSGERALYAVNVANGAVTEYDQFPFDFFGQVGNDYVGANSAGLYLLDGDDDAGAPIAAVVELPPRDFRTTKLKTLPYVYVESRTDAEVRVTATADEATSVTALTQSVGRNRRAKLARGLKGVQWAVRIENTNGEPMAIDSVDLLPMLLNRKV